MKKFKIGQHIRLKILPNSNIEIIDINNAGYIYMGDAVVNGSIVGQEKKIIPFEYEDDYEVIDFCKNVLNKQDEEKIRELAYKRFPENISYSTIIDKYKDYNLDDRNIFIEGAKQMAAWKEQQMIEKAEKWFCNYLDNYIVFDLGATYCDAEKAFEDFKKAMEEK